MVKLKVFVLLVADDGRPGLIEGVGLGHVGPEPEVGRVGLVRSRPGRLGLLDGVGLGHLRIEGPDVARPAGDDRRSLLLRVGLGNWVIGHARTLPPGRPAATTSGRYRVLPVTRPDPTDLLITGATVCAPDGLWSPGWLHVGADGRIAGLGAGDPTLPPSSCLPAARHLDARGLILAPGFIDLHVHGGDGAEAMDADPDGLRHMARFHARHGVTGIVPTTWAAGEGAIRAACEAIAEAAGRVPGGATILGAHLEGPWINPNRCGAQDPAHIRPPDAGEAVRLLDTGVVRLVALAPEIPGSAAVIGACRERGVTVSAGHTEAGYDDMVAAVAAGVRHVTHTYNAMGGLGHREPGAVGAALALPELRCEVIADGIHVHPGALAVLARAKGPGGVVLVSDATRAAGLPEGVVDLGGREGYHCGGAVRLADGRLAGSALTLDRAVATFARATGWGWEHLWRAAAANAAAALGLTDTGSLVAGHAADLVLLDGTGAVVRTMVGGETVFAA